MIQNYTIITDSACDLAPEMLDRLGVLSISLNVFLKDSPAVPCTLHGKEFFQALRDGQAVCTSAANLSAFREMFAKVLSEGKDLLYLSFSSALSCMHATARIAAEELQEEYPDRTIRIVDTLCACLGQGLLVYYAAQQKERGLSLDDLTKAVTAQRLHTVHWFTVDDLMFLRRGGRIGNLSAMAGTLLGIKPVMYMNSEGKLALHSKVRGRKNAVLALAKHFGEECLNPKDTVFIAHADAAEDAEFLKETLQKDYGVVSVIIGEIGAVIGAHCGPGTISVYYFAEHREG